jgi:dihydrofolate reductase
MISIIVAISEDYGIGKDNRLLWKIPADLKRFRKLTMGNSVIMGKNTWESLPLKPLPGRVNIVLTDIQGEMIESAIAAYSIEDALRKCEGDRDIFIIGGASIYRQFMPLADRLYITHVYGNTAADTWFPEIKSTEWEILEKEEFPSTGDGTPAYSYVVYKRK